MEIRLKALAPFRGICDLCFSALISWRELGAEKDEKGKADLFMPDTYYNVQREQSADTSDLYVLTAEEMGDIVRTREYTMKSKP